MSNWIKFRLPSPALVIALIALSVSLAGNAGAFSAGHKIKRGELAKGAVTASALANGAVTAKALKKGAVTAKSLAADSVGSSAIKRDAVTANALASGSVGGFALGGLTEHSAPIADLDMAPENGTWTTSNTASAVCGLGERLLSGGIRFTNPGNREVGVVVSVPFTSPTGEGMIGQITSNSGGSAQAEVKAFCLK
jgi:hypothetical protein